MLSKRTDVPYKKNKNKNYTLKCKLIKKKKKSDSIILIFFKINIYPDILTKVFLFFSVDKDTCADNLCTNGGTCISGNSSSFDDTVYCICSDDYTGNTCETLITGRCLSDPCQNGGSCVETNNEQAPYQCDCGQGYPGSNCEGIVKVSLLLTIFSIGIS